MLEAIVQSPHELMFALLTSKPTFDLQILEQTRLQHQGWQIGFAIIGSSHSVTLAHESCLYFQEILACLPLRQDECLYLTPYTPHFTYHITRYHMRLATQDHPLQPLPAHSTRLHYAFPPVYDRIPITEIIWSVDETQVQWWTLHTYPQTEGEIQVRTYTEFKL